MDLHQKRFAEYSAVYYSILFQSVGKIYVVVGNVLGLNILLEIEPVEDRTQKDPFLGFCNNKCSICSTNVSNVFFF